MEKTIVWRAPFFDPSGYGSAGRGYVTALHKANIPLKVVIRNFVVADNITEDRITSISAEDFRLLDSLRLVEKIEDPNDVVFVDHNTPNILNGVAGAYKNVAYSVWETNKLPSGAEERLQLTDEVWTASEYSKIAFVNSGVAEEQVIVVPHVCDGSLFDPAVEPLMLSNKCEFNFLTNIEFHRRKGFDILLPAFFTAFRGNKDVGLIFKTYNLASGVKTTALMREYVTQLRIDLGMTRDETPSLIVLDKRMQFGLLPRLYASADAYVCTTRGEAWCLPLSEAVMMELPTLAPNIGGQMQFYTDEMGYLIDSKLVSIQQDDVEVERNYEVDTSWVESDFDDVVDKLRYIYNNYEEAKSKAIKGREILTTKFSPEVIAELIKERMV